MHLHPRDDQAASPRRLCDTPPPRSLLQRECHPRGEFSAKVSRTKLTLLLSLLQAWPEASFFAAPYVRAGIDREYEEKIKFWPTVYPGLVPEKPRKPDVYPFSFTILPGNANSPIVLLGPVQGDTVDHSLFWLPKERTIITGDCMYARSTHVVSRPSLGVLYEHTAFWSMSVGLLLDFG